MNHVFEMTGAPIPPYYALLGELEKEVPAMEHGMMIDADNKLITEDDLSSKAKELLHDYRLVQYDLSVGKRYSQERDVLPHGRRHGLSLRLALADGSARRRQPRERRP